MALSCRTRQKKRTELLLDIKLEAALLLVACDINLKKKIFSILYILPVRLIVPQIHHTSKMVFSDLTKYMTKGPIILTFLMVDLRQDIDRSFFH